MTTELEVFGNQVGRPATEFDKAYGGDVGSEEEDEHTAVVSRIAPKSDQLRPKSRLVRPAVARVNTMVMGRV